MTARSSPIFVLTHMQAADGEDFSRLKRKKWCGWQFLISGEWSQTPWNQGENSFFISHTKDKHYWALLNQGFPRRIVAVAHVTTPVSLEEVAASMMYRLASQGGEYIESPHNYGDIDPAALWTKYDCLKEA